MQHYFFNHKQHLPVVPDSRDMYRAGALLCRLNWCVSMSGFTCMQGLHSVLSCLRCTVACVCAGLEQHNH